VIRLAILALWVFTTSPRLSIPALGRKPGAFDRSSFLPGQDRRLTKVVDGPITAMIIRSPLPLRPG
jgi:hypothetical protein